MSWWRSLFGSKGTSTKRPPPGVQGPPVTEFVVGGTHGPLAVRKAERLPLGRARCPKCQHELDIASNTIAPPETKKPKDDDEAMTQIFMKGIGEILNRAGQSMPHLRCPKCGTTWMQNVARDGGVTESAMGSSGSQDGNGVSRFKYLQSGAGV